MNLERIILNNKMYTSTNEFNNQTPLQILCNMLDISIKIISIEGNIGSGKSTLCNMINRYFNHINSGINYHFVDEPVEEWETIKDKTQENKNMLELFYENQNKYSFVFQTTAYITRLQQIKNTIDKIIRNRKLEIEKNGGIGILCATHTKHIIVLERSLQTDRNVFAKMLYNNKKINEIEWQSYNYWFNNFVDDYGADKIIYVRIDPSLSYERTKKRSRNGEESIPLEYLEKCHHYHEQWIDKVVSKNKMVFDASKNIINDNTIDLEYITPIIQYIYTCS